MSAFQQYELQVRRPRQVKYDFTGTSVLITGAAHGQGRLHALRFAECGANLALCDLPDGRMETIVYAMGSQAELEEVAAQCRALGATVHAAVCDVRSAGQVQEFVDGAHRALGKIDVAIANAGIAGLVEVSAMTEQDWDVMLDTNLKGVFLTLKHASKHMLAQGHGGSLIATGSVHTFTGVPGSAHYAAAKHGIAGFCKSLAIELAPAKIRVNYVCPSALNTQMVGAMNSPTVPANFGERLLATTGCWNFLDEGAPPIQPSEITEAVMYLASDASLYVTGVPLIVDAGFTAK